MMVQSPFGTFTPPGIVAEALRQSIRELTKAGYDKDQLILYFGQMMSSPESWIGAENASFSLHDFVAAHNKGRTQ